MGYNDANRECEFANYRGDLLGVQIDLDFVT